MRLHDNLSINLTPSDSNRSAGDDSYEGIFCTENIIDSKKGSSTNVLSSLPLANLTRKNVVI